MALRNQNETGGSPKIMSGARAKVYIEDPNTALPEGGRRLMGIFSNISYGVTLDATPAYILGRYGAAEIDYTSASTVNITCGGWRAVGLGPHRGARVPRLQDLLNHQYITFEIFDRQTGEKVAKIEKVRPTGFTTGLTARQLEEMTTTYVGLLVNDEDETNSEAATPSGLPATDLDVVAG